jgi:integrase/recombinase XerD
MTDSAFDPPSISELRGQTADVVQRRPANSPDEHRSDITGDAMLVEMWLAEKADATADAYFRDFTAFFDWLAERHGGQQIPLRYVALQDIQAWRDELNDRDYAEATTARKLRALKSLFSFGTKLRYFEYNVAAALSVSSPSSSRAEKILSESELWQILENGIDPGNDLALRNHCILQLFYASAGRVSDLEGLRWEHVQEREDLDTPAEGGTGGQVTFEDSKGGKTRTVAVYGTAWQLLEHLRMEESQKGRGTSGDPVFVSMQGNQLSRSQLFRIVKEAATEAGVKLDEDGRSKVSPHWFRHASLSHALMNGANLELVRETAGHDSIETTKVYLHSRPDRGAGYHLKDTPSPDVDQS